MSKGNVKFEDGKLIAGLDTNEDGENVLTAKLNLNEGLQEALGRVLKGGEGEKIVVDAKKVELEFGIGGLKLLVDTDGDGEKLLELDVSLTEAADEITSAIKKD